MPNLSVTIDPVLHGLPLFQAAKRAAQLMGSAGFRAWFVGGTPRDILLGKIPHDIDIATDATPDKISQIFEHSIPVGAAFGIITVLVNGIPLEIATLREERGYTDGRHPDDVCYTTDPEIDVRRRDFTVNALFFDPATENITDWAGGIDDLRKGLIRCVGDPIQRFEEDHLRILRAVRFAVTLGFDLEPATRSAIARLAPSICTVSRERVAAELQKILLSNAPSRGFRLLAKLGLLREILPEIDALRGLAQPPAFHPEGDVFEHTMLLLDHAVWPDLRLRWAALLHDIGKAKTQTIDPLTGTPHFYGHETAGADMSADLIKRLRLPNTIADAVVPAVRNHMKFAHVDKMKTATWKRMIADPNFPLELELHRLDCIACHGLLGNYLLLLDRLLILQNASEHASPKPFLNGKDLLARGYLPGKAIGAILHDAYDLQLEGMIPSREEAIAWLDNMCTLHSEKF